MPSGSSPAFEAFDARQVRRRPAASSVPARRSRPPWPLPGPDGPAARLPMAFLGHYSRCDDRRRLASRPSGPAGTRALLVRRPGLPRSTGRAAPTRPGDGRSTRAGPGANTRRCCRSRSSPTGMGSSGHSRPRRLALGAGEARPRTRLVAFKARGLCSGRFLGPRHSFRPVGAEVTAMNLVGVAQAVVPRLQPTLPAPRSRRDLPELRGSRPP